MINIIYTFINIVIINNISNNNKHKINSFYNEKLLNYISS